MDPLKFDAPVLSEARDREADDKLTVYQVDPQ
jgi:hypothetical protein